MWRIEFYETKRGESPVKEFIDSLDTKSKGKMWELRAEVSKNQYRVIYFASSGQVFWMLHGFGKKTGPVPERDLRVARVRRDEVLKKRG